MMQELQKDFSAARVASLGGVHWLLNGGASYALLNFWGSTPTRQENSLAIAAAEGGFVVLVGIVCWLPAERGHLIRVMQYLAAAYIVFQFCYLDMAPTPHMDGGLICYYLIFKQMFCLGFAMSITRKKVQPVCYHYFPLVFLAVIATMPSTNFYLVGVATYPYFPRLLDRILWTG